MKKREISTPEQLDVALSASALRKHSKLWRIAEGRSFRWAEALGLTVGVLFLAMELVRGFSEDSESTTLLALGVLMVGSFVWGHMQRQVNALVELVKNLESERYSASRDA